MAQDTAEPPVSQIVASVAYVDGRRARDVPVNELGNYVGGHNGMLWLGLRNPSAECLGEVIDALGASAKAREEMLEPHRRPKIIDYGNAVLVVAMTVDIDNGRPIFGETQYLIGNGFLVTVRRGSVLTHSTLRERLESAPDLLKRGSDYVASELLDLLVDRYVAAVGQLESVVEHAEQKLLIRGAKDSDIRKLYRQRRDLLRIHTAIAPMAEICRRMARVDMSAIDAQARPYFAEVADRVVRVDELINALREALAFAFEASLMIGQAQQNDTTRKLASWAAILAVPTAIAGIYGMNFEYMPELKAHLGYPITLSVIAIVCGILYWRFRKSGWL
ncbi:magnesium and cobalt transport protein CorA [Bordetella avium]|uniref:Magnesium transporter n=1 Tax=Bordetella avium (strain 197N) TaxID=360910 RepID=Q2KX59_BORA1|nr:magnesium and cobalt transport protein CorA [Bordetella avium]AZY49900.1 magnesium and cobalt transport protein CorA [Bordetella avium]AZY53237.1 magnesium and cobalt transport protein CorA [Bordetella avium]RIQ13141.1 magnesium and cobalt transport protein CorA [Bordetella avium]RIQ17256.1 magnesium and cobalt transport protein CorA [Bordetella avium]RIQ33740.1 magnesium and cobalt transport protein CorA [Bordetella avium]